MVEVLLLGQRTVYTHTRTHRDQPKQRGREEEMSMRLRCKTEREKVRKGQRGPWRPEEHGSVPLLWKPHGVLLMVQRVMEDECRSCTRNLC